MNLEPTEKEKAFAKKHFKLSDDELDSFWFRMGVAMVKKSRENNPDAGGEGKS